MIDDGQGVGYESKIGEANTFRVRRNDATRGNKWPPDKGAFGKTN